MHRVVSKDVSALRPHICEGVLRNPLMHRLVDSHRTRPCAWVTHCISQPTNGLTHQPQPTRLRIKLARRAEHFHQVAHIWAEALLLQGLTEPPPPATEEDLRQSTLQVADRLRQSYERKFQSPATY
ncbi:hypothetical protein Vafri_15215, partial [Volvox africanus]